MLRFAPALFFVAACAGAAYVSACAGARDDREEPTTPAAMVGLPSPVIAPIPVPAVAQDRSDSFEPALPIPRAGKGTRVIADAPPPEPAHRGRRIDLDVKGADIHDVLRLLAEVGHVSIVVSDDVQGSVTLRLRSVPWEQALDVILRAKGLFSEREGSVILVTGKVR